MTDPAFLWATREYSLRQFVDEFVGKLPVIAEVVTGQHGMDSMHTFSSDEIYFIHHITHQKRIVCLDGINRRISIPLTCPYTFRVIDYNKPIEQQTKEPQTVQEIMKDWSKTAILRMRLDESEGIKFCVNNDLEQTTAFGVLEIIDEYDESYLIANSLIDGEILLEPILIPVYVSIELAVAVNIDKEKNKNKKVVSWPQLIHHYTQLTKDQDVSRLRFNSEILELPPDGSDDDAYDYIEPASFFHRAQLGPDTEAPPLFPKTYNRKDVKARASTLPTGMKPVTSKKSRASKGVAMLTSLKNLNVATSVRQLGDMVSAGVSGLRLKRSKSEEEQVKPNRERMAPVVPTGAKPNAKQGGWGRDTEHSAELYDYVEHVSSGHKLNSDSTQIKTSPVKSAPPVKHTNYDPSLELAKSVSPPKHANYDPCLELEKPTSPQKHANYDPSLEFAEDAEDIYVALAKVPSNLSTMTVSDVSDVLRMLGMTSHISHFEQKQVDGPLLSTLDNDILVDDFGFRKFDALKLMKFVRGWRPIK